MVVWIGPSVNQDRPGITAQLVMSREYSQHDFEVDSSEIFRPDVGNLSHVRNLADLLKSFGYNPDDRVERRELCNIWATVKRDIEAEIVRLAHNNGYEHAKKLRARLVTLRGEFDGLQTNTVKSSQMLQHERFTVAEEEMNTAEVDAEEADDHYENHESTPHHVRLRPSPIKPTQREIDEHFTCHLPFAFPYENVVGEGVCRQLLA